MKHNGSVFAESDKVHYNLILADKESSKEVLHKVRCYIQVSGHKQRCSFEVRMPICVGVIRLTGWSYNSAQCQPIHVHAFCGKHLKTLTGATEMPAVQTQQCSGAQGVCVCARATSKVLQECTVSTCTHACILWREPQGTFMRHRNAGSAQASMY